jgi:hypothetical protein
VGGVIGGLVGVEGGVVGSGGGVEGGVVGVEVGSEGGVVGALVVGSEGEVVGGVAVVVATEGVTATLPTQPMSAVNTAPAARPSTSDEADGSPNPPAADVED